MIEELKVLLLVAIRNLALHKVKTLVVGGILLVGSFLVVFGLSLLGSIENTMSQSIIGSVAGHLQVYSSNARDELALFGSGFFGRDDLGEIEKFEDVKAELLNHPNVADVVPLGFENAFLGRGNLLDDLFERFRATVKAGAESDTLAMVETIKTNLKTVRADLENELKISSIPEDIKKQIADVEEALSENFWSKLPTDPESVLLFLESKIAPLSGEKEPLYLRYMGTNPEQFTQVFRKFKIVSGENCISATWERTPNNSPRSSVSSKLFQAKTFHQANAGFCSVRESTKRRSKTLLLGGSTTFAKVQLSSARKYLTMLHFEQSPPTFPSNILRHSFT